MFTFLRFKSEKVRRLNVGKEEGLSQSPEVLNSESLRQAGERGQSTAKLWGTHHRDLGVFLLLLLTHRALL